MTDSNSLTHRSTPYPNRNTHRFPTKHQVIQWLSLLNLVDPPKFKIEDLGKGDVLCRIINHYMPNTINENRIIQKPLNQYEYGLNLKHVQIALSKIKINVPCEINKLSNLKFTENWNFISKIYSNLHKHDEQYIKQPAIENSNQNSNVKQANRSVSKKSHLSQEPQKFDEKQKSFEAHKDQAMTLDRIYLNLNSNLHDLIDRAKQILLGNSNDSYKIQLINRIFGIEQQVKLQEESTCLRGDEKKNQLP